MKRVLALTSAALLATSMLAFPVLAQDDDDAGGSASASSSASAEASSSASVDSGKDGVSGSADSSAAADAEAEAKASDALTEAENDGVEEAAPTEAVEAEDEGATEGALEAAETEVAPEEDEMETATTSSEVEQTAVAIGSSNTFITQIANVGEGATVHVVNIGIENNFEIANTIEVHADEIDNLQNAIASNGTLVSALEAEDVNVSSIVGASADGDQLILYNMRCDDAEQVPVCS